ncbi:DUF6503 family protein [Salegentibacter sediminis]|uniref:DUF6503 family protein n=1 Tax=Salegentibacter sediminis TaxID=1930251 RepID=UPI0009BE0E8E|nr:DUF6503 family protein [Salegentibacter sediminis]
MKQVFLLLILIFFISCEDEEKNQSSQETQKIEEIIEKTIETAGGENYTRATITFNFRDRTYKSMRRGMEFSLERQFAEASDSIRDVVSNSGFHRYVNDSIRVIPDSLVARFNKEIKTVNYFAHLPYGLDHRGLVKELVGEAQIKGEPYFQLKMLFGQGASGVVGHDEFIYWIHKEDFTLDYLAYKFVEDEDGIRFRAAYNPRSIKGIRFVDYKNYTYHDPDTKLSELDELYEADQLELLSTIETEILEVELRE